jgi:PIN domain nuclease of toxin-antitoxin system
VKLILDTQALWWLLAEPERLRANTYAALGRPDARLHYSPLSILELAIKRSKGKFEFADSTLIDGIESWSMAEVPVRRQHALRAGSLPPYHSDPFDRLIIAQAVEDELLLVSSDKVFRRYDVPLMRA